MFSNYTHFSVTNTESTTVCNRFVPDGYEGIKLGDRIGILIDFQNRECSFKFNGKIEQKTHKDIPREIVPTFTVFSSMDITCTQWIL